MTKYTRKQQVFDHVARHLIRQGRRSLAPDGVGGRKCVYRTATGKRCAVGCLIAKRYYDPVIEGNNVDTEKVKRALRRSGVRITKSIMDLLKDLQVVHDYAPIESPSRFRQVVRRQLADLAQVAGVNTKVLGRTTP